MQIGKKVRNKNSKELGNNEWKRSINELGRKVCCNGTTEVGKMYARKVACN